jgi:hypothetical protein
LTVTEKGPEVEPVGTFAMTLVSLQNATVEATPFRDTALLPCVAPKPDPAIVTKRPMLPVAGVSPMIFNPSGTLKLNALLATPFTVTTTFPVVAPVGTGTTIEPVPQVVGVAVVPLNFTVLVPCVEPKFAPEIVTDVPTAPDVGDKVVRLGVGNTVYAEPALATPFAVITTLPVVAPSGTGTTIEVALQLPGIAVVPWNVTELVPCAVPKFVPVIVTEVPTGPEVGDKFVIPGVGTTVKAEPLLLTPLAFTTTFPVVAPAGAGATIVVEFHEVIVEAAVPLNVNVPVPCGLPKFVPVTVTEVPAGPVVGDRLVILGAATTVNGELLLATLFTATTTFPVVAPLGTVATIDVCVQLVIAVAAVPLNFNVLVP